MWYYNNLPVDEDVLIDYQGFVYQITNMVTGRKYIGKKNLWATKTRVKKGKKKREKVSSDWQSYYGSSAELQEDVKKLGPDSFKREILEYCPTKGILNYRELVHQIENRVLEKPDEYYNAFVGGKFHRSHIIKKKST